MRIMTKILFSLSILFLLSPITLNANNDISAYNAKVEVTLPEAKEKEILERLNEIQQMDFKNMSGEERKALREELKEIKDKAGLDNRISISVGALIIIILLVILIF